MKMHLTYIHEEGTETEYKYRKYRDDGNNDESEPTSATPPQPDTPQAEEAINDEEALKLPGKQLALGKISEDTYKEQKALYLKPEETEVKTKKFNDSEMGYR